jgi:hypothetical protein
MSQTTALFHDAYRELNSKRMFWIVLILSGLVVLSFALIGVNAKNEITLAGIHTRLPAIFEKGKMFKLVFYALGIQLWLAWIAMILAIISTSSMFPDLMTGGSIDLYLSKPISRLRLFLTKYAAGMVFVALQVTVFAGASFLVIGLRGGAWEPRLFMAVPLVVCVFSYLWCICAWIGVKTRSTLAAALLTIVAWLVIAGVDRAEFVLLLAENSARHTAARTAQTLKVVEAQTTMERRRLSTTQPAADDLRHLQHLDDRLQAMQAKQKEDDKSLHDVRILHTIAYRLKTFLPKTRETNDLLVQCLLSPEDLRELDLNREQGRHAPEWMNSENFADTNDAVRARPVWWIVGTSMLFELAILALAARSFIRRDF